MSWEAGPCSSLQGSCNEGHQGKDLLQSLDWRRGRHELSLGLAGSMGEPTPSVTNASRHIQLFIYLQACAFTRAAGVCGLACKSRGKRLTAY